MLITPDTLTALKQRMGAELATLQAAMIASPAWTAENNHDFGPTAQSVLEFVAAPVHLASLAADYNDGISRRTDMLGWWQRLVMVDPNAPPVPSPIKQPDPIPNPISGFSDTLKTGAIILGVGVGAVFLLQLMRR